MLSTHIMQEVKAICDRVIIIKRGHIDADDNTDNLQYEDNMQVVYEEFYKEITKNQLNKISGVSKIQALENKNT
jgi:ABC-2 type transport system ATP-binding protein